jgi:hypothetical protein
MQEYTGLSSNPKIELPAATTGLAPHLARTRKKRTLNAAVWHALGNHQSQQEININPDGEGKYQEAPSR